MKKIFIALAAIATIAACNKAEVLETSEKESIAFTNPFVDNSTKADKAEDPSFNGTAKFEKFQVWGTANGVAIFEGNDVVGEVGTNSVWECTKKQYWVKDVAYKFAAVANGNVTKTENGLPKTVSYTANGTSDLVYAENLGAEGNGIIGQTVGTNSKVAFTFTHLLAKVKFTVETNTTVEGYSYEVTDIKVNNAYASGLYDVTSGVWTPVAGSGQEFGAITVNKDAKIQECEQEKLLIPMTGVTVSYKIALKYGTETIWSEQMTGDKAVSLNTQVLAAANSYNFKITANVGEEIKFTVEENPTWTPSTGGTTVTVQ